MSGALLLVTLWAFWDDEFSRRGFKQYQEQFYKAQYERARAEWVEANDKISAKEKEIAAQLENTEESLESSREYQALVDAVLEAQIKLDEVKEQKKFAGSRVDEAFYYYKKAMHGGENYDVQKATLNALEQEVLDFDPKIAEKKAILDDLQTSLMEFKSKEVNLKKELRSLTVERDGLSKKMDYYRPFNIMWKPSEILQTVIPGFSQNSFSEIIYRVDRCMTCHISYEDTYYEKFEQPLKTHPNLDILIKKHPPSRTGCTWCHMGQGSATAPTEDAHGSHHETDQTREVNEPILHGNLIQGPCRNCHDEVISLEGAPMLTKGKQLFQKLGCHGCHLADGFSKEAKVGPRLNRIKYKVGAAWLFDWIKDPKKYLPDTRMPNFNLNDEDALAITAYLMDSSDKTFKFDNKFKEGSAENGKKLFESVGCYACHKFKGKGETFGPDLTNVGNKVRSKWLINWISLPHTYNDKSRMPNLRISYDDAADISAFLLKGKTRVRDRQLEKKVRDPELVKAGKLLVSRRGCFACHDINGMESMGRIAPELSSFGRKMIVELEFGDTHIPHTWESWVRTKLKKPDSFRTERVLDKMPNFNLTDDEIDALVVLLKGFNGSKVPVRYQKVLNPKEKIIEKGRRLITKYNCRGCHSVEGKGGDIQKYLNGNHLYPPPLEDGAYHVGERIKASWLFSFLKNPTPVRTWVKVKMPTFFFTDEEVRDLTAYFEALSPESIKYESDIHRSKPKEAIENGVKAVNYMDCGKCHDDGAKGIDFSIAGARLKQDWIPKWLENTRELIPWTKMPNHWDKKDGKLVVKTKFPELKKLGTVDQQAGAIRDYIVSINTADVDNTLNLADTSSDADEEEEEEE
ncbi:MAG: cytochrome C [Nitrospinae bacterium CG11_big_fil_rev_8_21_14_0_20_45_15]|nr:MAG: cytochrome C [Nitrospinae bacterium CG11_big_fil_rev_8_21_14_0_20_45_15]